MIEIPICHSETKSQCVDRDCVLACVVLQYSREERLCKIEPRKPEHCWCIIGKPVGEELQSVGQSDKIYRYDVMETNLSKGCHACRKTRAIRLFVYHVDVIFRNTQNYL